jgi:hypothetical protein
MESSATAANEIMTAAMTARATTIRLYFCSRTLECQAIVLAGRERLWLRRTRLVDGDVVLDALSTLTETKNSAVQPAMAITTPVVSLHMEW